MGPPHQAHPHSPVAGTTHITRGETYCTRDRATQAGSAGPRALAFQDIGLRAHHDAATRRMSALKPGFRAR